MESGPRIVAQRFPYEEPYHTELSIAASNGRYSGHIQIYCGVDAIQEIGQALAAFPRKVPDEYIFECGSENPNERWAYYLKLRAYTLGLRGQPALQVQMNLNGDAPNDGRCSFSIADVEAAQISRLGRLFLRLHSHASGYFLWTPAEEEFRPDPSGAVDESSAASATRLSDRDIRVEVGRIAGGSFVRVTHLPTGKQRMLGPIGAEPPAVVAKRLRAELEAELREGLTE